VGFRVRSIAICRVGILSFAMQTVAVGAVPLVGHAQPQAAATVRHIAVTGDSHDVDVKITASKPVTPRTQFVTDPDRLIVDLPESRPDAGLQQIPIHRGKLRGVRVGLLSENPPVTRVVLDLTSTPEFRVSPLANIVVVKLGDESGQDPAPEPVAPTANPPVSIRPDETTSVASIFPLEQPTERSWAHWIMPILVTTTVLTMLVIALVANIQNRRHRRGI
jgi:hypothetical protein